MTLDANYYEEDKKKIVNIFLNKKIKNKYILGTNSSAMSLSKIVNIDGFIDDFTNDDKFCNKPLFSSSQISKDAYIVSCSISIYPLTAMKTLKEKGINKVITIFDFIKYANNTQLHHFLHEAHNDIIDNFKMYEFIYTKLYDDTSKEIFLKLVNFRKHLDLDYLKTFYVDPIGQYFEDFLKLEKNEVFVDAGAYDGQTTLEFIKHCPNYKSIYVFEPSKQNLSLAKKNLNSFENIFFIPKGLSNKQEIISFNDNAGSASNISLSGGVDIETDTLDTLIKERTSFIKMDIEGAESLAIEGMSQHIINDHPKLAISVYHKADDLWKIPMQILAIRNDYNLHIRHYTEGTDETIMFFLPQQIGIHAQ